MIDYRCPHCRRLVFKAAAAVRVRIEHKCNRCKRLVEPQAVGPLHATYECAECGQVRVCERPPSDLFYCVRCGLPSLRRVYDQRPVEARDPKGTRAFLRDDAIHD